MRSLASELDRRRDPDGEVPRFPSFAQPVRRHDLRVGDRVIIRRDRLRGVVTGHTRLDGMAEALVLVEYERDGKKYTQPLTAKELRRTRKGPLHRKESQP